MSSLFTKIIQGEVPCYKIYEDDVVFAFLDIFPFATGHCLIIPKVEIDNWLDIPQETYLHIHTVAPKIAKAIKIATNCQRVGQIIDGRQIPHCHLHLIPLVDGYEINQRSISKPSDKEFLEIQSKIIKFL